MYNSPFIDNNLVKSCPYCKDNKHEPVPLLGSSWSWSYGNWISNYLCNQCLSQLMLWVRIQLRQGVLDTTLCDKVCQWLAAGQWFSLGTPASSNNKTDLHNKPEILLKVALNTITLTLYHSLMVINCIFTTRRCPVILAEIICKSLIFVNNSTLLHYLLFEVQWFGFKCFCNFWE